jgi:hypothetical protein
MEGASNMQATSQDETQNMKAVQTNTTHMPLIVVLSPSTLSFNYSSKPLALPMFYGFHQAKEQPVI